VRTEQLVIAARRGDPTAFAALVDGAREQATMVVARMLGDSDHVEDVVQDALVRAYLGLSQLRRPASFAPWLCGIAVNVAKMHLRRRAAERRALAGTAAAAAAPEEHELLELVQDSVALLPSGQREVVLLHYVDGLSCDEIAAVLDRSPGAVRVRLHRARAQLRARLAPLAHEPPTTKEERPMVEMTLDDVLVRVADDDPTKLVNDDRVVMLKEKGGERVLPIWIGPAEGNMLALPLTGETTARPVTPDLMAEIVRATGARVERVAVTSLRDNTFFAGVTLGVGGRVEELDARPSDAINLAVRVGAPIFADAAVLDETATTTEDFPERVERDAAQQGRAVPPGAWRSLSAELLHALFTAPREPPRP